MNVKRSVVLFCKAERSGLVRRDVYKVFIILVIVTVVRTDYKAVNSEPTHSDFVSVVTQI